MDVTQVVIHFIGLVLFTTRVPNDPGLHAILPAIHATSHQNASPDGLSPSIEPHVTVLIFHKDLVLNDSGWKTSTILSGFPHAQALASYNYVELNGEHITFAVDAQNFRAGIPVNMPHFSCGNLGLTSEYRPPYSKAAAVIDIPAGTLSVCEARNIAAGRIDSRLVLNTSGKLTIVATKAGAEKKLVLKTTGKPMIYLANVPPPLVKGMTGTQPFAPHYLAYWRMIGRGQVSGCSGPPTIAIQTPHVSDCERPVSFLAGLGGAARTSREFSRVVKTFAANAECSNTQWP